MNDKLWLEISETQVGAQICHRDVVTVRLLRLDEDLHSERRSEIPCETRRDALKGEHDRRSGSEQSENIVRGKKARESHDARR